MTKHRLYILSHFFELFAAKSSGIVKLDQRITSILYVFLFITKEYWTTKEGRPIISKVVSHQSIMN